MIAEDIEVNFEIVDALLEPTGVSLDWVKDGRQAVEVYKEKSSSYDLILMDIQMPELNGFDATRDIRNCGISGSEKIPIIAMTANVFAEDIAMCYQCGMDGHLGKPLDALQLIGTINHYLKRKKAL